MSREQDLLEIVQLLMRVMLVSERTAPAHQHVVKFNMLDFQLLGALREAPSLRATALAERLGIAPTTMSSVIARLRGRGLLAREKSKDDRRAFDISLTTDGRRVADAIAQQDIANMRLFLSALPEADQDRLLHLLGQVAQRVQSLEEGGSTA
ncbi:MarR family transcriptional regulator [Sulfitobacter albidus]|uniref:MarR family transcriptional regulator n=1 Tax=Sulfitobacter albidus TaxID=2829501 RepID=A0A975PLL4_9RHOB|nr:MarR family transcriptional regulator [Sulfitobacter albidus]QUJ75305.1 MarR family transcriptional regulator [Sulfitobacter albidus]